MKVIRHFLSFLIIHIVCDILAALFAILQIRSWKINESGEKRPIFLSRFVLPPRFEPGSAAWLADFKPMCYRAPILYHCLKEKRPLVQTWKKKKKNNFFVYLSYTLHSSYEKKMIINHFHCALVFLMLYDEFGNSHTWMVWFLDEGN